MRARQGRPRMARRTGSPIVVDTSVSIAAARSLLERCSCALSRMCVLLPGKSEGVTPGSPTGMDVDGEVDSHRIELLRAIDVGDIATTVADSYDELLVITQRRRDSRNAGTREGAAGAAAVVPPSKWAWNNALRCVGVGDGLSVCVADGQLVLLMLEEYYLGLGIPGARRSAERIGGKGRRNAGNTVLLRLSPQKCKEHEEKLRKAFRKESVKLHGVLRRGDGYIGDDDDATCGLRTASVRLTHSVEGGRAPDMAGILSSQAFAVDGSDELAMLAYEWLAAITLNFSQANWDDASTPRMYRARADADGIARETISLHRALRGSSEAVETPKPPSSPSSSSSSSLSFFEWGMLASPRSVSACITELFDTVDRGDAPWCTMTLFGFRDSPVFESGNTVPEAMEQFGFREGMGDPTITLIISRPCGSNSTECTIIRCQ